MNISPRAQTIAGVLRTEIEAWRRAGNLSREAVAAMVIEAHQALGGEAATGVEFSFAGDTYTQAKKAAQKLYRWLDVDGTLPANMVSSILASLPLDVRLHCLNQVLRPVGIEARSLEQVAPARFDGLGHLQTMIKETAEAQSSVLTAASAQTPASIRVAIKEVAESIQVQADTKRSLEAALLAHEFGVDTPST